MKRLHTRLPIGTPPAGQNRIAGHTLPSLELRMPDSRTVGLPPTPICTPLLAHEEQFLQGILRLELRDVQTRPTQNGTMVRFALHQQGGLVARVMLFVDAQNRPVRLSAMGHQANSRIDVRCGQVLDDRQWMELVKDRMPDLYWQAADRCLPVLAGDGPRLGELGLDGRPTQWPLSENCLRALVQGMAARDDDTGAKVRHGLEQRGISAATLYRARRPLLVDLLRSLAQGPYGTLALTLHDLRSLPHHCLGILIDRICPSATSRNGLRSALVAVLRSSEPIGNGNLWPAGFVGGVVLRYRPQSPHLAWLFDKFQEICCGESYLRTAANLLRCFEARRSPWDAPHTIESMASLTRDDVLSLGIIDFQNVVGPSGFLGWLQANKDALKAAYPTPPGPPKEKPPLAEPTAMPTRPELRDAVVQAMRKLQDLCVSEGGVSRQVAQDRLLFYGRMMRTLESKSLREVLFDPPAGQAAFDKLPRWMVLEALPVLEEDHQNKARGDRSQVLACLARLPVPVLDLLPEAVTSASDARRLRPGLVNVHDWPLYGNRTPDDYRSPVWLHQRLLDRCAQMEDSVGKRQLRSLLRRGDQHWRPGVLSLAVSALLVPDNHELHVAFEAGEHGEDGEAHGNDPSRVDAAYDGKAASQAGRALVVDQAPESTWAALSASLRELIDAPLGREIAGERAVVWPELTANRQWFEDLRVQLGIADGQEPDFATKRAMDTVGLWMRYQEHGMPNLLVNHVERTLLAHAQPESFLNAVEADLSDWRQSLSDGLDETEDTVARGRWRELHAPRGDGPVGRLRLMASLDEPKVREAFERLHKLVRDQVAPQVEMEEAFDESINEGALHLHDDAAWNFWQEMEAMTRIDVLPSTS